jgi:group I intron endonuclease
MNSLNISGVYKIVNTKNGKIYIGSSKNILERWECQHKPQLRANKHINPYLQNAWNKYGESSFDIFIIEPCDADVCLSKEQYYLDLFNACDHSVGYNVSKVAGGGDKISYHPNLEEIRQKQRENTKKRWKEKTEKEKEEYREKYKGKNNPNWKNGVATSQTCVECGTSISYTSVRCMDCSKKGKNNPFYQKTHSEKTKQILSDKRTGFKHSETTKELCKTTAIDYWNSEAGQKQKEERSLQLKGANHHLFGVGHSPETREKMTRLARERRKNFTIEYRFDKKCRLNHFILRYKDVYYLTYPIMALDLNQDLTTLRFKCLHVNPKWADYEAIKLNENLPLEIKNFYLLKLKENKLNTTFWQNLNIDVQNRS